MKKSGIDEAKIREAAYLIWLEEGQPEGRDEEHWRKAIAALTPAQPKAKAPRKAAAKTVSETAPKPKAAAKPRKNKAV